VTRTEAAEAEDTGEIARLKQELEEERLAAEQLRERVKALRTRREQAEAQLEEQKSASESQAKAFDATLQSLRAANDQLRENNAKLREAAQSGVVEPHLINKAMMAELEGLRAARSADRAEADALLKDLDAALEAAAGDTGDNTEAENA
jgi:DNA repair exonuclease SbcCD ATPase subunit